MPWRREADAHINRYTEGNRDREDWSAAPRQVRVTFRLQHRIGCGEFMERAVVPNGDPPAMTIRNVRRYYQRYLRSRPAPAPRLPVRRNIMRPVHPWCLHDPRRRFAFACPITSRGDRAIAEDPPGASFLCSAKALAAPSASSLADRAMEPALRGEY